MIKKQLKRMECDTNANVSWEWYTLVHIRGPLTVRSSQLLATGLCFSPGTPIFPANKTDRHDITEILLKMALKYNNPTSLRT